MRRDLVELRWHDAAGYRGLEMVYVVVEKEGHVQRKSLVCLRVEVIGFLDAPSECTRGSSQQRLVCSTRMGRSRRETCDRRASNIRCSASILSFDSLDLTEYARRESASGRCRCMALRLVDSVCVFAVTLPDPTVWVGKSW